MKYRSLVSLLALSLVLGACSKKIQLLTSKEVKAKDIDKFILHQMDSLAVPGVSMAIINNSEMVYHRTFGVKNINTKEPIDSQSLFDAGSLTKTLFAYFALKSIDKGQLDLDKPLYEYLTFPDIEYDEKYKLITARMVLSHSSGFPNWRRSNKDNKLDIKFSPGTDFNYSGEGYEYLANVLAKINNVPKDSLQVLIQKDVFEPLRIRKSSTIWNFYASYSLQSEASDYAKLLMSIMKGPGLSEKMRQEMLKVQIHSKEKEKTWGLGIEIHSLNSGKPLYMHGGFNNDFSSGYLFSTDKNNGYVFFANSDTGYKLNDILRKFFTEKGVK
jgi:CubicO group peptidase (beta-lactamase class C family)